MKNKGFTLVELLAVIAILGILVIVALPNVVEMFNESKKNTFINEARAAYKVARQKWTMDPMKLVADKEYSKCDTCTGESLDLTGRDEFEYNIKINTDGVVTNFFATDGTYKLNYTGNVLVTDINDADKVSN